MQTFLNIAVWVWLAEIFPLHMRGLGFGISAFFGWTTNGFLALFFPSLVEGIGITGSFFLFAAIGVVSASVRLDAGARDPGPFPRGAGRGRDDRGDLRRYALSPDLAPTTSRRRDASAQTSAAQVPTLRLRNARAQDAPRPLETIAVDATTAVSRWRPCLSSYCCTVEINPLTR